MTPNPTETSLGRSNEREDLLEREARDGRVARWGRAIARVAVVFSAVVLAALLVAGPDATIGLVVTYLVPLAVIIGLVVGVFVLVGPGGGKDYDDSHVYDEFYRRF